MNKEFLPQGDNIRQLLVKSNISQANINLLLREKGVYLGHSEKNNSVPLLMKSIISPSDFETLYSTQKTKEDRIKYKTASIKCRSDFNVATVFSTRLDLNQFVLEKHTYKPNYKVLGNPSFYFEDENTAILEYKIERENLLNDWTNNKTYHSGSVILKKLSDENIQVTIQQNSTSKETVEVNNIIINNIKTLLNKNSIIESKEDFITIKFNDFTNSNRIKFLYSFTAEFCIYLEYKSITDIDLSLDPNIISHQDIKYFLEEIDNLKLKGKGLQKHTLLNNEVYYPKFIFGSIKIQYKLKCSGFEGTATLNLSFPEYINSNQENSELQISIDLLLNKEYKNSKTENEIRKKILSFIEKKKLENYSQ
ncbi:hypothetical protein LNJ05_12380 [Tenacibaculum finnmarkense genomovar ulcerans]|uniref:GapS4b family protein n=1 Tax=Tenacibaculum finnmarkense TaxID=2781243 RepID=UPI001E5A1AA8|nr:hypothetical protein [Tenacibaculum finnmarkense]MCD8433559.1 hypothetical protein [Tenacibaculum finnmarkense genomovar ulcerans]